MKQRHWITELRATALAVVVVGILLLLSSEGKVNVFSPLMAGLHALGEREADEIVVCGMLFGLGVLVDMSRTTRKRRAALQQERMRIFRATMATVQDLVNNALNTLQLLRLEAEESHALSPESLARFDTIVHTTAQQLTLLGNVEDLVVSRRTGGSETVVYATEEPH